MSAKQAYATELRPGTSFAFHTLVLAMLLGDIIIFFIPEKFIQA